MSRTPGEGQLNFDGEEVHNPAVDPTRPRNALARVLTPEYLGLSERDYYDVTPDMVQYVAPDRLRPYLIDIPAPQDPFSNPNVVSYDSALLRRQVFVAITAREAKILPRYVGAMQRNARINAEANNVLLSTPDEDARAQRAPRHVLESKLPVVREYKDELLVQRALLGKFIMASSPKRNSGLSMFGKEGTMREKFAYLEENIISDMVQAYASQRQLSADDRRMVAKAVTVSIVFARKNNQHIEAFNSLVNFLRVYNSNKLELASQRIANMQRTLGRYAVSDSP